MGLSLMKLSDKTLDSNYENKHGKTYLSTKKFFKRDLFLCHFVVGHSPDISIGGSKQEQSS